MSAAQPNPQTRPPLAVDAHVVAEGERVELIDGERVVTPPAREPHGTKHFELAYLLGAHVAPGYRGAVDLLVRAAEDQDFAPDASVYPEARDPATGGRQLDVLAFEIVGEQALAVATRKARALVARGVRRVFCIHLDHNEVLEWDRAANGWTWLAPDAHIADESLACALPVAALLDAVIADEAVVYALRARGSQALRDLERASFRQGELQGRARGLAEGERQGHARGLAEGELQGRAQGLAEGEQQGHARGLTEGESRGRAQGEIQGRRAQLLSLVRLRFGEPDAEAVARLDRATAEQLDALTARILTAADLDELFG